MLKQNIEPERRKKTDAAVTSEESNSRKRKQTRRMKAVDEEEDDFTYIEDMTIEQLKEIEGKYLLGDPGHVIFYIV